MADQIRRPALRPVADLAPELGLGLEVQLARADGRYVAILEVNGKSRRLSDEGSTCEGLANALVISLAILLDSEPILPLPPLRATEPPSVLPRASLPSAFARAELPNAAVREADIPSAELPPADEPLPRHPGRHTFGIGHPFHLLATAGPVVTYGVLNGAAGGVTGEVERRVGDFSVSAGVFDLPGAPFSVSGGTVSLTLTAGFLRACGSLAGDGEALRFAVCFDPMVGLMRAEADAAAGSYSSSCTRAWAALAGGLLFHQHITGPLAWGARADFLVPAPPVQFYDQTSGHFIFSPSPVGGSGSIELRVSISVMAARRSRHVVCGRFTMPGEPAQLPVSVRTRANQAPRTAVTLETGCSLLSFKAIYDEHFRFVWRSLRRLGVPESDTADAVQDVFLVGAPQAE